MAKAHQKLVFTIFLSIFGLAVLTPTVLNAAERDKAPVRFAILGDRTSGHVPGIYGRVVEEIQLLRPDFVITVGDMIEGYVDDTAVMNDRWGKYLGLVKPLTMPLYYTPGNNDISSALAYEWYKKHVGRTYYSFDHENLHFIILDNSRIESSEEFPPDQLSWLIDDLQNNSEAAYTFVFMHKPFWNETTAEGQPDTLHTLFVKFGVDAVFCGHYHEYFSGDFDGVMYMTIGSSGGGTRPAPNGLEYHYGWVTVDGEGIHPVMLNLGSVMPREVITVAERKTYRPLQQSGISFDSPLPVEPDLTVKTVEGEVTLHNIFSDFALDDTLRWEIPEGWTVAPAVMPVSQPARTDKTYAFTASCAGPLFPAPTASVNFTYGRDKKVGTEMTLTVARTAYCNPADKGVKIDGRIDEAFWKDPVGTLFSEDGGPITTDPTEFYFAYDKDNLYLAAKLTDQKIDSLKAKVTEQDGAVYGEDCVGYFLAPHEGRDTVYQIYFNFLGSAYDHKIWKDADGELDFARDFNGEYEVKAVKDSEGWAIEIRIPALVMGLAGIAKGDKWKVNFRRKQPRLSAAADWQIPIGSPDYRGGWLIMR